MAENTKGLAQLACDQCGRFAVALAEAVVVVDERPGAIETARRRICAECLTRLGVPEGAS